MKILMDIQAAVTQRAGVGRYTRELLLNLPQVMPSDSTLTGFYFDFKRRAAPAVGTGVALRRCGWCPGRLVEQAWKRGDWPPYSWFAGPADLYHFPNFTARPVRHGHIVITVHDVSFVRYPEYTEARNLAFLSARLPDSLRRADAVITISRFSAGEICEVFNTDPQKVMPVPLGIGDEFCPPDAAAVATVRQRYGLDRPFLLTVGTLEPRKNLPFLIECFERLDGFDGDLVLAGMKGWQYEPVLERMATSCRQARIRHLDGVPDADMPALYGAAELFVCSSVYEGFGFPPLEAMACGTPVLTSSGGSLRETAGEGGWVLDGFDPDAWAAALQRLLEDTELRRDLQGRGQRQAAQYRWHETARRTWEIYQTIVS